jgi:hypothetical protein
LAQKSTKNPPPGEGRASQLMGGMSARGSKIQVIVDTRRIAQKEIWLQNAQ